MVKEDSFACDPWGLTSSLFYEDSADGRRAADAIFLDLAMRPTTTESDTVMAGYASSRRFRICSAMREQAP